MRIKTILPAALIVLATATGAFAQQMPNDRTGDHMFSYGAAPRRSARHGFSALNGMSRTARRRVLLCRSIAPRTTCSTTVRLPNSA